jgi:replicative DNA helicase
MPVIKIEYFGIARGREISSGDGMNDSASSDGGEMIVIAARPSMGKTSLAMNIAEHVAIGLKLAVGVFSLEMTSESLVRRMHPQYGIKLFVVDYWQLLHSTARRAENRQQEIADISSGIKSLAKELNVPVIVLSQLNRELEREKNRKPRLSDLRSYTRFESKAKVSDEDVPN